ncbi:restriction endonuclease subunit S [Aerococcus urinaeequi]|uniref:restriction endonuclease subunit S n=1 Tax=Aerococcus urinaeequi TaxID=51665 RepID=UPI003B3B1E36
MADTVALMRKRVLDMAIRGELVEQRSEDGTAEELIYLLKEAKQKKTSAIKSKKIEIKDLTDEEIPFKIPETWDFVPLGNLLSVRSGLGYKKANLSVENDNMVRVLRGGNISDGTYVLKGDDVMISKEFVKDELLLQSQDMISPAVTSLANIGKVGMIEKDYTDVTAGGFVLIMRPYLKNKWTSKFVFYFLNSEFHRDRLGGITNKSGQAFYNLSRQKLVQLAIPLPPIAEQKRIVAKIEEIFAVIDQIGTKKEEALSIIQNMRQTALQDAIRGVLVEQDENDEPASILYEKIQVEKEKLVKEKKIKKGKPLSEVETNEVPFDIPESWKWVRLGNVIYLISGRDLATNEFNYENKGLPYITGASNFNNGELVINRWVENPKVISKLDDLLITVKGTVGEMLFQKEEQAHIARQVMAIRKTSRTNLKFIKYFLDAELTKLKDRAKSMIPGVSREDILHFEFPMPPLVEQERIVDKLDEIMEICDQMEAIFDGTSEMKMNLNAV